MLNAVATAGYIGRLPTLGPILAAAAGLAVATAIYFSTGRQDAVMLVWALVLVATAWALPRAMTEDIPNEEIVIDRFAGIWLAAAPALPLADLLGSNHTWLALAGLFTPLVLYSLLLAGPLRRAGQSQRPLFRIGDDLLAGLLAAVGTVAALSLLLL